ncbi:glycosyltransferase family 4 protein [Haloarcula salinisoli]|uniref:Glycosyltransferase family 4 protein n=1 Tax=Haloarcula salinisoli TaxID=2487746 RepID=A0A8J7YMR3_9EURY|nr:glycosyltransferase family 4 protein [Halomicroarcula salinisoli]MBX0288792.1 glycosyltransferase family 4 protein [Halomicroarcula salinisoli]MBX0306069.1 glycosyltransferase family 4 protein [Halomicroarcula salinisoli]
MKAQSQPRVLLCSDYLPPSDGGVEQVVEKLAVNLVDQGFEVGVFTLTDQNQTINLENTPGVSFYTSSAIDLTESIGLQSMVSVSALTEFRGVVNDFQPDIVHAHNRFFYTSALAALYSLWSDYELVTTLHLGDIDMISGIGGAAAKTFEQSISRFVISRSSQVIGVSRAVESIGRSLGATDTSVVRNAVDVDAFAPSATTEKSIMYIGRLVRNNGVQDLLAATPQILEEHPNATLHIVGSGPLEEMVRTTIRSEGMEDSVQLHSYIEDISDAYDMATVFCRPSYSEGLPLTMLEAMSSQVVPVVTDIAGVSEVVTDGKTGILLEPGNIGQLEARITELLSKPAYRETIAAAARDYVVDNLTWEQRTEKVINAYQQVY